MSTVAQLLADAAQALAKNARSRSVAAREAEELLTWALGVTRERLFAHPETRVSGAREKRFRTAVVRRTKHEPLEYIVGQASFMGRDFRVTPATLIPRNATELIVQEVLAYARTHADGRPVLCIDVGTGSGAIAVTLAAEFPRARVLAIDISPAALAVARANARRHGVAGRIRFVRADLLPKNPLTGSTKKSLTIVVANLPYIPSGGMRALAPSVRRYEPRLALVGGKDGLGPTRRLLDRIAKIKTHGALAMYLEILPSQQRACRARIMQTLPSWRSAPVKDDRTVYGVMMWSPAVPAAESPSKV